MPIISPLAQNSFSSGQQSYPSGYPDRQLYTAVRGLLTSAQISELG